MLVARGHPIIGSSRWPDDPMGRSPDPSLITHHPKQLSIFLRFCPVCYKQHFKEDDCAFAYRLLRGFQEIYKEKTAFRKGLSEA
jgi:hypothetical protein